MHSIYYLTTNFVFDDGVITLTTPGIVLTTKNYSTTC